MNKFMQKKSFVVIMVVLGIMLTVCMTGCHGSCLGCTWGCDSESNLSNDASYNLGGISWVSEGCCASSSCKTAMGDIDLNSSEDGVSDMFLLSCTHSSNDCSGSSSCYNGCFVGKDIDCGDCGITYGSTNGDNESETLVGCVDGCFDCANEDEAHMGFLYEIIYELLGI